MLLISNDNNAYLYALLIFSLASITDYFDGKIARKYNAVSRFGLFMDPIADKALVLSAFYGFMLIDSLTGIVRPWMFALILFRDIFITLLRIYLTKNEQTMITSKVAKLKTAVQLTSIIFIMLVMSMVSNIQDYFYLMQIIMFGVTFFTVFTGFDYLYRNLKILNSKKI